MNSFLKFAKNRILSKDNPCMGDCIFWSIIFALLELCLLYSGGIVLGFISSSNYSVVTSLYTFLLTVCTIIAGEFLRAVAIFSIQKASLNRYVNWILSAAIFAAADLLIFAHSRLTPENKPVLILYAFYSVINSLLLTALCYKGGAAASIIFVFITKACVMLLPFEPAINEKMEIFIKAVLCMIFLITLDCAFSKESKPKEISFVKRKLRSFFSAALISLACFVLAFICGFLTIAPVSVATGSMQPQISVGDVVLVSKSEKDFSVGDIIQFKRNGKTVIHRIISYEQTKNGSVYITKGDANNAADTGYVTSTDIVGKVIYTIPQLGNLTLWLHSQ